MMMIKWTCNVVTPYQLTTNSKFSEASSFSRLLVEMNFGGGSDLSHVDHDFFQHPSRNLRQFD